jgi:membrane protein YqaA with SNARE-associated domain
MKELLHRMAAALLAYGPWGVFLLAAVDSMGVPLPAALDVLVIGVAAAAADAPRRAWISALLAVLGSVAGNIFLFQAARQGRKLIAKPAADPGERRKLQRWFDRYGLLSVFLPAVVPLIPLPLKVFVITAGAMHTPFGRFLAVILAARILRYFGIAWLALQLGKDAEGFIRRHGWGLTGGAIGIALAAYMLIRLNDRRRQAGTLQ